MDFNKLKTFIVVAELGSVTEAAYMLFRTQPAISKKLKGAVSEGFILRTKHKQDGQRYFNYIYFLPRRFMTKPKPCDSERG